MSEREGVRLAGRSGMGDATHALPTDIPDAAIVRLGSGTRAIPAEQAAWPVDVSNRKTFCGLYHAWPLRVDGRPDLLRVAVDARSVTCGWCRDGLRRGQGPAERNPTGR